MTRQLPDITLERFRLGELPLESIDAIHAQRLKDEALDRRLSDLEQSDAEIRGAYSQVDLATDVRARLAEQGRRPQSRVYAKWAIAMAVVLAAVVVVPIALMRGVADRTTDDERVKGSPVMLMIYRSTVTGSEALNDNDSARPGDMIRVGYRAATPAYGLILSIDGRGVITQHLPATGARALPLNTGEAVLLDSSFELDDAPSAERFLLVSSPNAFDIAPIVSALKRAALDGSPAPKLAASMNFVTFSLRKDPRP